MLLRKLQTLLLRIQASRALKHARTSTSEVLDTRSGKNILVVCHGNIYRSPLVGVQLFRELGQGFAVQSAGFHPVGDRPSPQRHVEMCARLEVDISRHRSCVVSAAQVAWADIIVLMDRRNWVNLRRLGADPAKLVWLGALTEGAVEIEDPYGLPDERAQAIAERLVAATNRLAQRLQASPNVSGSAPR